MTLFSNIEIQMIRASLATKTNEELAELLERPLKEVIECIDQITGGGAEAREERIIDARKAIARMEEERRKSKVKREYRSKNKPREKTDGEIMEQAARDNANLIAENQRMQTRLRESRRTLKTRTIDYSKMKSVLVAKGTYVWVEKSIPSEEAIRKYNENRSNSKDAVLESDIKNFNA